MPWDWAAQFYWIAAGAYVSYAPGLLRFQTEAQLGAAAWLGMNDEVILQVNNTNPPLYKTVRFLGARVEANYDSGWSAELVTYVSDRDIYISAVARFRCAVGYGELGYGDLGEGK